MKKIIIILAATLIYACSSTRKYEPQAFSKNMPEWVMKGGAAFKDKSPTVFYGVGVSNYMPNTMLMRETADSRARAQLATEIKTSIQKMVEDYIHNNMDYFDKENTAGSDELVQYVSKEVIDTTLVGASIIDRWQDPETKDLYSLARIDLSNNFYDEYKTALKKAISKEHFNFVKEKKDEMLKKLNEEIEKQRKKEKEILSNQ